MKKDLKYIIFLAAGALLYIGIEVLSPKPVDWTVTFSHRDKNPFGAYLINERMPDLFPSNDIKNVNLTLYELQDSTPENVLILASTFSPTEEDVTSLLEMVHDGANVFIAAEYFSGTFSDSLKLASKDYFFNENLMENIIQSDTAKLHFVNTGITSSGYSYRRNNTHNYFSSFDTVRTSVLALNDLDEAVFIQSKWGAGNFYLCTTPLAFTNNYLLFEENNEFTSKTLSHLPKKDLFWTEYYQLGRMEAQTPLRFILTSEPLKWGYYIAILSLLLFILFETKRKQRIIPIITPLGNTTLEFVGTISNLYFYKKDHRSIAEKRINFFMDQLRSTYRLSYSEGGESWLESVAGKTGKPVEDINDLFNLIQQIRSKPQITEQALKELNNKMDDLNLA
ncbi:DUF4350 domain-containing protein [Fulvivirga sp. M361]|uniref:DUF4350 domain-containing protein n=1 Tax=Fulvivirga sp. M361 TaxID=2594266 RepID=UPI00117BCA01|nr:DUF4350 domain-containing protein [Fulvivirga sp. M361]TRX61227.1 DUF4350 domain-containing protein [Fulvivirga sp. M361]